ncbi:hypothetical protein [Chitinophaga sp. CF418]|uniref:hypothetical protein n=1 Tax=Chitinophaga sp. CF418 TaxID=1855287 RepID=UPI0009221C0B|nr:hypothetical protein [Chitinophaga sp. CF418]SHN39882.1 hypothetical protein SAMN05216311_111265 [Chitinophaga sp. CF418]
MIIKNIAILSLLLLAVCEITTAQTTITFEVPEGKNVIDSIQIHSPTNNKLQTIPFKNNIRISFTEKFPERYMFIYLEGDIIRETSQYWIDTGNIRIVVKGGEPGDSTYTPITETIIGSPLTYKAIDFLEKRSSMERSKDTAAVNSYLIRFYKENMNNPLSFVAGDFFYLYNRENNIQQFTQINSLDELQDSVIKKNGFYAKMLNHRLWTKAHFLINFFNTQSFNNIHGGTVTGLIRPIWVNVLFFLNDKTPAALKELAALKKALPRFTSQKINLLIAVNKVHYPSWKNRLMKLHVKDIILVDGDTFFDQTSFSPFTKFYFIEYGRKLSGYYDSFDDVKKIYSSHYEGSL